METKVFIKGDLVPDWVERAKDPEYQKEATFGVDVLVETGDFDGAPVRVRPIKPLGDKDFLIFITARGATVDWSGSPTFLDALNPVAV